jgi:hypothetical protein
LFYNQNSGRMKEKGWGGGARARAGREERAGEQRREEGKTEEEDNVD